MLLLTIGEIREASQREQLSSQMNALATEIYYQIFKTPQNFVKELSKTEIVKKVLMKPIIRPIFIGLNASKLPNRITSASIVYLMDTNGFVVISSRFIGHDNAMTSLEGNNYVSGPIFCQPMQVKAFVYPAVGVTTGERGFYCSSTRL
jgi:C4-dicarboxylate-specific signal transduction histidine kinase